MGFFRLYKAREYKPRYIYYDPKKDAKKEREMKRELSEVKSDFQISLHRGSFREQMPKLKRNRRKQLQASNIRVLIIIAILVVLMYFLLR